MPTRSIRSMCWRSNIDTRLVAAQAAILRSFDLDLIQDVTDSEPHDHWLQRTTEQLAENESVLYLDIDAFPLNRTVVERAFEAAERGEIFGAAQAANHLDPAFVYAGPMFLCFSKKTWIDLDRPSFSPDSKFDVAARLSQAAFDRGVPVHLLNPSFVGLPRWPLAGRGCLGTATFYEGCVFHLFQSRSLPDSSVIVAMVADPILRGEEADYLAIHRRLNSIGGQLSMHAKQKWMRLKRKWARSMSKRRL